MAIGIVDDSEFELEINKSQSIKKSDKQIVEIITPTVGRGKGNKEVPDSLRKIIGETSEIDGRAEALKLAKQFGISNSSVSAYASGKTSTSSELTEPGLINHINQKKERISKKAQTKLMLAISHISDEKLKDADALKLSLVAKNMSGIVKDMEPDKANGDQSNTPKFVFYSPTFKDERHYETIVVNE